MSANQIASAVALIERVAVVRNPLKTRDPIRRYVSLVRDLSPGTEIDIVDTCGRDDLTRQTEQIVRARSHDLVVVAGGDGTLLQVLQGVGESEIPLTVLPQGTSNDYAKALGIASVEDAARALVHGTIRKADRGVCTYRDRDGAARELVFCSTAGVGLMAGIFRLEQFRISGALKNLIGDAVWPILATPNILLRRSVPSEIRIDGHRFETRLKMLEVTKVAMAGGTVFAPFARIDSGSFDAWMLHNAGRLRTGAFMISTLLGGGRHMRNPRFEYFTRESGWNGFGVIGPTRLEVVTRTPVPVHVQGDWVGFTPASFALLPRALTVLAAH
jgi:diacylglycerol kinase (ATP)